MDDASVTTKLETPAAVAGQGMDVIASTVGDMLDRSSAVFNAGLRYWQTESVRFVEDAAMHGQAAFARLCTSKTPLDVLAVEQEWLRARNRSALDAGVRLVDALAAAAASVRGEGALVEVRTKARKGEA